MELLNELTECRCIQKLIYFFSFLIFFINSSETPAIKLEVKNSTGPNYVTLKTRSFFCNRYCKYLAVMSSYGAENPVATLKLMHICHCRTSFLVVMRENNMHLKMIDNQFLFVPLNLNLYSSFDFDPYFDLGFH